VVVTKIGFVAPQELVLLQVGSKILFVLIMVLLVVEHQMLSQPQVAVQEY